MNLRMIASTIAGLLALVLISLMTGGSAVADQRFQFSMGTHYIAPVAVPTSPTDVYTSSVWLKSIEFIPQSTTSPTCTVTDKSGSPITVYNAVQLTPNHSYRDERSDTSPLFMNGGIRWSCSDATVVAQLMVKY